MNDAKPAPRGRLDPPSFTREKYSRRPGWLEGWRIRYLRSRFSDLAKQPGTSGHWLVGIGQAVAVRSRGGPDRGHGYKLLNLGGLCGRQSRRGLAEAAAAPRTARGVQRGGSSPRPRRINVRSRRPGNREWVALGGGPVRDDVISALRQSPAGLTTNALFAKVGIDPQGADAAVAEAVLLLSAEITCSDGRWRLADGGRVGRVLAAVDSYVAATGKKIFRAAAALESLPPHEHPTQDELQQALAASGGRYELLPNLMIRRNG
jgi:hypothetical protein